MKAETVMPDLYIRPGQVYYLHMSPTVLLIDFINVFIFYFRCVQFCEFVSVEMSSLI